jgi:hypothetical protein
MEKLRKEIVEIIKEEIICTFGNVYKENDEKDIFTVELDFLIRGEKITLKLIKNLGEPYIFYEQTEHSKTKKIIERIGNALSEDGEVNQLLNSRKINEIVKSYRIYVVLSEIILNCFKKTRMYKMRCLYDSEFKNIFESHLVI